MKDINLHKETKEFYEEIENVWPEDDQWHLYSKNYLSDFISRFNSNDLGYILNAGSGGTDYNIKHNIMHLDIAGNKISHFSKYTISSIEETPFKNETFDTIICVGSVLNYTDAIASIAEFSRILKPGGTLILEFESSWGFEHLHSSEYKVDAAMVTLKYNSCDHKQWIYAPSYVYRVLKSYNLSVKSKEHFHIASAFHYQQSKNENAAAKYTKYDNILRCIPIIRDHSNNVIFSCTKLGTDKS